MVDVVLKGAGKIEIDVSRGCFGCILGDYIQAKFYDAEGNDANCSFCKELKK